MNIGIVANPKRTEAVALLYKVIEKLNSINIKPYLADNIKLDKIPDAQIVKFNDLHLYCDIVIAIGGDGTIIKAAKKFTPYDIPVLGINGGKLGYLAALEPEEIKDLTRLVDGKYTVENRMMLKVEFGDKTMYALNDVVVSRGVNIALTELTVDIDNHKISYRADGIAVATPTGSTAYSLSAGGPVLEPSINNIIIQPICPHSLISRSLVLCGDSTIKVSPANEMLEAYFSVDGEPPTKLNTGDIIKITRAEFCAKIINFNGLSFFDVLSEKLR